MDLLTNSAKVSRRNLDTLRSAFAESKHAFISLQTRNEWPNAATKTPMIFVEVSNQFDWACLRTGLIRSEG